MKTKLSAIILIIYNILAITLMMVISHGTVYMLTTLGLGYTLSVIIIEWKREYWLVNCKQHQFTGAFMLIILLSLYYSVGTLTLLIYFNYNSLSQQGVKSMIVIGQIWINLVFYGGNAVCFWLYTISYYRMFWVNNIQQIFQILKKQITLRNDSLIQTLRPIKLNPDIVENICSLCLENYQMTDNVSKLVCKHDFHRDCIKIWITKNSSCPLCRTRIIIY